MRYLKYLAALLIASGDVGPAPAQDYPNRPVRILVQFPPGGVPDATGRMLAEKLQHAFGKPFVVENRLGAGGNIATEIMVKSDPDGHTLLAASSASVAINPNLYSKMPYEPGDLAPVSLFGSFDFVMVAAPTFAPNSVRGVIELAKAQPGKFNIASSGFGSEHHLAGELFKLLAGINLTHVPYKGFGPAAIDTVAGQVELMFGSVPAALQLIKGGKLKALAVTGNKRSPDLPDVPTFAEAGYPGLVVTSWTGLLAPARTPKPILDKINEETVKVLQTPDLVQRILKMGLGSMPLGPKPMAERIVADTQFWARVIKQAGIKQVE